jgi:hypothetical protein
MNSLSASVTATFLVGAPLTSTSRSRRSGSSAKFVSMCAPLCERLDSQRHEGNISRKDDKGVDVTRGIFGAITVARRTFSGRLELPVTTVY